MFAPRLSSSPQQILLFCWDFLVVVNSFVLCLKLSPKMASSVFSVALGKNCMDYVTLVFLTAGFKR